MEDPKDKFKNIDSIYNPKRRRIIVSLAIFFASLVLILFFIIYFSNKSIAPSSENNPVVDEPVVAVKPHYEGISSAMISESLAQYIQSLNGTYSLSMVELSGQQRSVSYDDKKVSISASTYKLYVAYSVLKRIENGLWHWSDGLLESRDMSTCFDDMIVDSDNDCAEAFLNRIERVAINTEAHSIGCIDTLFSDWDYAKTTASDLALFLVKLETGQILDQQSSRDRLIDDMKRNIFRDGIPAGTSSLVADKTGVIDDVLNDVAIIYSPTGTYVLTIMTDNSSWGTIADLTSKIEALRAEQVLVP